MDTQGMECRVAGALPLLQRITKAIGLVETIDQMVPWDPARCRLSPGTRIEALILNILAGRSPLYRVADFYEDTATELVFGDRVLSAHLTDDCLARALDKLVECGPRVVFSAIALRACLLEGIERDFLHYDTTSVSLFGDYPDNAPGELQLVRGYSKDQHPDLKQLIIGLLCNRQGIPVWSEARDGNSEDTQANHDAIDLFCAALSPEQLRQTVYVADSKLVCGPNLHRMAQLDLRFVSRLPESFAAAAAAKRAAHDAGQWQDLGQLAHQPRPSAARYRASEQVACIDGRDYRLVVMESDHLAARKRDTFARALVKRRTVLEKEVAALAAQRFLRREEAEAAAGALLQRADLGFFPVSLDIQEQRRALPYGRRGRPRKDEPVRHVREFRVIGSVGEPDPQRLAAAREPLGLFVLMTNLSDRTEFPARRLLEEYRDQSSVEQRFAFLKDPVFVDGIFLHTPSRIDALVYVLVMACLLYSIFERRVRLRLQATAAKIQLPGKKWSDNPTGKMLLSLVSGLSVGRLGSGPWRLVSPPHMTERAATIARLAGFDLTATYTAPPT